MIRRQAIDSLGVFVFPNLQRKDVDMDRLLATAALVLLCQACANTPSTQAASVREVDASQVGKCALISNITGKSLLAGGVATSASNAMTDAKEQAAGLGANVVVIQGVDGGSMYAPATARVKAYRCN
jgi:hypothetical protein